MTESTPLSILTEKGQTTIPASLRQALGLKKGDYLSFRRQDNQIIVEKAATIDAEWARFTAHSLKEELSSQSDDDAFGNL